MGDETIIPHVIGTAMLLVVFFSVGSYYNDFYTNLSTEAYRSQLGQVAEYVSSVMIDLVTLAQVSDKDQFLTMDIAVPFVIGEKLYNVSLLKMSTSQGEGDILKVLANTDAFDTYALSDLPWTANSNVKIYSNETVHPPLGVTVSNHLMSDAARSKAAQTKNPAHMIVWCDKNATTVTIGLGVRVIG